MMELFKGYGTAGDAYHKHILKLILANGYLDHDPRPKYSDGTPAHTYSVNHVVTQYDLHKGESPILTLRPIAWKSAIKEILWIYQMQSNKLDDLHNLGIRYWDEWDIGDGTIGQRYGATVKKYDLVNNLLDGLKNNPFGRRHIMSMWQVDDFNSPGLNPCCYETIWNVRAEHDPLTGKEYRLLDMMLVQRSSDTCASLSINELQYTALQMMVAREIGMNAGVFTHVIANCQIYDRHREQAKKLIHRKPIACKPMLLLKNSDKGFYDFTIDDFELVDYPLDEIKKKNPQLKFDLGI